MSIGQLLATGQRSLTHAMHSGSHRSEVFAHHTALSMLQAPTTKTRSPWATADISLHSHEWIIHLMCFTTEMFITCVYIILIIAQPCPPS